MKGLGFYPNCCNKHAVGSNPTSITIFMNESDIINKWIEIGWKNAEDYHASILKDEKPIVDAFHPDKLCPKTFWSAADEHFHTDPVANSNIVKSVMDVIESNLSNHKIARYTGMISQLEFCIDSCIAFKKNINIAEIGCGYGSLYHNFIIPNKLNYTGFDIIKRFDEAVTIEGGDGTFTYFQEQKYKNQFNIFYASNTFQHLSPKQIENYLRQVYYMLPIGGYFNLMYIFDIDYTYHYGQQIKIIEEPKFIDLILSVGYSILQQSKQFAGHIKPMTFLLSK